MIHPNLIKRKADEDGLPAPVVERDYVLAHALAAISRHDEQGQIVFKGGTALRLCHFEEYRYSADLDFSLVGGLGVDSALQLIADALAECRETIGFPVARLTDGTPPRIEYVGPLEAKLRRLKLDLADDDHFRQHLHRLRPQPRPARLRARGFSRQLGGTNGPMRTRAEARCPLSHPESHAD